MHHLSSSVAMHVIKNARLPFKKREFPKLTDKCLGVMIENFQINPKLEEVNASDKEFVRTSI